MKLWMTLVTFLLVPACSVAQESMRALEGPGAHPKYLTPGQMDIWTFDGEKGETIIAHIATREFDSILELAIKGDKDDKVLYEIDDEGSESRLAVRLPEKGEYKIRVHGFQFKGGGNYVLHLQRFQAAPLPMGKPIVGTLDREGKSYYYFPAEKDQYLIPDIKGTAVSSWKMLDFKGREMPQWSGTLHVGQAGEHYLVLAGHADHRYDLLLRQGRQRELRDGQTYKSDLQQGELDVWSWVGKPGDFRLLEIEKQGEIASQLIFSPLQKKAPKLGRTGELPELQFKPVASRGSHLRYAALVGRDDRYQLQVLAQTPTSYTVKLADPSVPLSFGQEVGGVLPVGGSAFYSFQATPGQLIQASLVSQKFIPLLRLYESRGSMVVINGGTDQEGRIMYMASQTGSYLLQVASEGDGGGGEYRLGLQEKKLKELNVGGRSVGTLQPNVTDFWAFQGQEGKIVILSVRSSSCSPVMSLHSPDGVPLTGDASRGSEASLLSLKLPKTGRYTIWVYSQRGAGEYKLRIIDEE